MLPRCYQTFLKMLKDRETSAARERAKRTRERSDLRCSSVLPRCPKLFQAAQHVAKMPPNTPRCPQHAFKMRPQSQTTLKSEKKSKDLWRFFFGCETFYSSSRFPSLCQDRFILRAFWHPKRPKTAQDAYKTPQDGHKTPQDSPRRAQDAPRRPQDAPKTPQERPKTPQDGHKTP